MAADLAVVAQDPRFRGGVRAQLDAFVAAAMSLERRPEVHYVLNPGLEGVADFGYPETGAPAALAHVDVLNAIVGGRRLARRVRAARSLWVVSTVASAGIAASLSNRPYGCWIGTGLADEWAAREAALSPSRRLALRLNKPGLLRLERRVLSGASAIYATSSTSRDSIAAAAALPIERIGILPIAVDTVRFSPLPDGEWLAGLDAPVIAFVGRADDPRKNVRLLLQALPEIRARVPRTTIRLIGRPPRDPLPDGAKAVGEVDDLPGELRRAAILVLPSFQEGFGVVTAEALACGVPVITTPSGGPEELVRSSGGGCVMSGWSGSELADLASGLLLDPSTHVAMRRAGRAYVVRHHSQDALQEELGRALRRLEG